MMLAMILVTVPLPEESGAVLEHWKSEMKKLGKFLDVASIVAKSFWKADP